MKTLILIALILNFTETAYADRCRFKDSFGRYVYLDCDRSSSGSLKSLSNIPAITEQAIKGFTGPTPLQAMHERKMQNQQHNIQMQILELQRERQRLELERYKAETERMKVDQQRPALNRSNPSYRGSVTKPTPRIKEVDASWSKPTQQSDKDWSSMSPEERAALMKRKSDEAYKQIRDISKRR